MLADVFVSRDNRDKWTKGQKTDGISSIYLPSYEGICLMRPHKREDKVKL